MPRRILPHLEQLSRQIQGVINRYVFMLDDEFLFASASQVPQVATIFDRVTEHPLRFRGEDLTLTELLTLIAYRYGLEDVRVIGHGGYAIVLGQQQATSEDESSDQRRVLRLVPEHHVRDVTGRSSKTRDFDVRLSANNEPLRDPAYPLLLSDLFLMPRHTTRLIFTDENGQQLMAGGYPAILHCQLLPEVRAFNQLKADTTLSKAAGNLLEAALATLGVSVADAHGGNGGVLIGHDGNPIWHPLPNHIYGGTFIPVVLDYGYYAEIGPRTLSDILIACGITREVITAFLEDIPSSTALDSDSSLDVALAQVIANSGAPPRQFGRLLYQVQPELMNPHIWIEKADQQWQTIKERAYPPLRAQARLDYLYPDYDEVIFPQRIEEYTFII